MLITHRALLLGVTTAVLLSTTACTSSEGGDISAPEGCEPASEVKTIEEGTLTVAAIDVPPVSVTADGEFSGVEPTLVRQFAEVNCLDLDVQTMSFAATIPAIQSGRADLALGGYYRTAERAKVVDLSDPVWLDQMGIFAKKNLTTVSAVEGMKVGTVDGYLWVPELKQVLGNDLTVYGSAEELRADLEAGRIEAAVDSIALAGSYDGYEGSPTEPDERVQSTIQPAQIGFPTTKGNDSLLTALNDSIATWHENGAIADALTEAGLPAELAETGEPRIIE